jgi:UDP-3-O-[3-hydroxymyristoyl] glucosamine N-acyltransferase
VLASELAALVKGDLEGGANPEITGVAPLDRAGERDISFLAGPKYLKYVDACRAGLILVSRALAPRMTRAVPRIVVDDAHRALAAILPALVPEREPLPGIHPSTVMGTGIRLGAGSTIGAFAVIGEGVTLGERVRIGAHCVVGDDCELGDDVALHSHVTLYARVRIGARSIVHSGARIGVDGFGYAFIDGVHRKIPQVGHCVIGSDVEIGANTTIDRGSIGATEIGSGTKIDNLVHIAHNVRIGENCLIIAQVGIAGSTTIGKYVTLAGQAGIPGHLHIGDGATVAAQAGVFGDLPGGQVYSGYPARPHKESLRAQAGLSRLPELTRRVEELERAVGKKKASPE